MTKERRFIHVDQFSIPRKYGYPIDVDVAADTEDRTVDLELEEPGDSARVCMTPFEARKLASALLIAADRVVSS